MFYGILVLGEDLVLFVLTNYGFDVSILFVSMLVVARHRAGGSVVVLALLPAE